MSVAIRAPVRPEIGGEVETGVSKNKITVGVILYLASFGAAHADLYKYLDKDGRITYSDQPPPAGATNVERKNLSDSVTKGDDMPFVVQMAAKKYPVTLYANDCGDPCTQAKTLLARRGVPFAQKNPQTSIEDADALKQVAGGLQVPTLTVGASAPLKGFEEDAWNRSLDAAGYPARRSEKPVAPTAQAVNGTPGEPLPPGSPMPQAAAPAPAAAVTSGKP
jgi:glutaredoxin